MYLIAPSPDIACGETNFATWENGFSDSEIERIIYIGENRTKQAAVVNGGADVTLKPDIRKSTISWIDNNEDSTWLYDKLAWIVRQLNGQFFKFDLTGFAEPFQYTTYHCDGDHYDWHIDKGLLNNVPRKLSLVLQLTEPSEYEGGDLVIKTGNEDSIIQKRKGLITAFPSWILHRVIPVTAGTRKSLVLWVGGPAWR